MTDTREDTNPLVNISTEALLAEVQKRVTRKERTETCPYKRAIISLIPHLLTSVQKSVAFLHTVGVATGSPPLETLDAWQRRTCIRFRQRRAGGMYCRKVPTAAQLTSLAKVAGWRITSSNGATVLIERTYEPGEEDV